MTKILIASVLLASSCVAVPVIAPPACIAAPLSAYIGLGAAGCSVSTVPTDVKVADFGFSGTGPLTQADILVNPVPLASSAGLRFAAAFAAPNGTSAEYLTFYTIDPPPIIHGFESEMETFTPKNGGKASITTELCLGAAFDDPAVSNACSGTLATLFVFFDSSTGSPAFQLKDKVSFGATNLIGVRSLIVLDAAQGTSDIGASTSTGFLLPEPGSALLVMAGLALVFLRRR